MYIITTDNNSASLLPSHVLSFMQELFDKSVLHYPKVDSYFETDKRMDGHVTSMRREGLSEFRDFIAEGKKLFCGILLFLAALHSLTLRN